MAVYKNVASQKIAVYAHDTAADEPKTGNAAAITAQISKDGGATAATDDVNPTELDATDAPGIYLFDMTQAETNADLIVLCAKSSTADIQLEPVIIYTVPGTNAGVTSALPDGHITAAKLAADCITADKIADDAIGNEHWNVTSVEVGTSSQENIATEVWTNATGAQVASDTAAILVDTAVIGAAGAGLTAVPWNAAWDAEVESECADALAAINLDHLMLTGDATLTNIVADNTALAHLMAIGADISDYDSSTDSLEGIAGAGGGGAPTVEQIRTEMDNNSTKLAAILEDTGTTLPATLATIDGVVDDILEGFDTTGFDSTDYLTDIKTTMEGAGGHLALILEDTGTTIPATLTLMSGATFDTSTDSLEAIRNRGDAAWTGGGEGGTADWTVDERSAIRSILGIPNSGTTPTDPTAGALADILSGYDDTGFDSEQFVDDVAAAVLAEIGTGWSESLTESYPAYGATPTASQMMWMIYAGMLQRELDGTTLNILESDGATAAAVFTITLNTQGYPVKVVRTS